MKLPVFHAARIQDIATARYAIAEGLLDMVAMTRAHMADPQIVNKLLRGEEERIRPCVGASYCMYKKVACLHNPATGREDRLPQIVERAAAPGRKVVVVGGGPAGLEAARVSAERGHRVVLFEAGAKLGGQLLSAVRATWRRDLIAIVDWRAAELERLGVEVRLNRYAEAADVLAEQPSAVIIATGGLPDTEWLDGAEHCTTVWDMLVDASQAKDDVLVYDGTGPAPGGVLRAAPGGTRPRGAVRHDRRICRHGDGISVAHDLPQALRGERRARDDRQHAGARAAGRQPAGRDVPP